VVRGAANAEIMFTLVQPWQGVARAIELREVELELDGQEVAGTLGLLPRHSGSGVVAVAVMMVQWNWRRWARGRPGHRRQ
jgi:hypothetical protein